MAADEETKPNRRGLIGRTVGGAGRLLKRAYIGDTTEIQTTHRFVKERLHRALHPGEFAHNETFDQAVERLGVSEEDLVNRAAQLASSAMLYLIVAIISLLVFCLMPWAAHPISHAVMSGLVLVMALAKLSVVRWRQGQIQQRSLMDYVAFWRHWWARNSDGR
ncbi:MAG: hypothetical protein ACREPE_08125 [Lysobacter sp.]